MLRIDIDEIAMVAEADVGGSQEFNVAQLGSVFQHNPELMKQVLSGVAWAVLLERGDVYDDPSFCEGVIEAVRKNAREFAEMIVDNS